MQLKPQQVQSWGAFMPSQIKRKTITIRRPVAKPEAEWADPDTPEFTDDRVEEQWDIFVRRGTSADGLEIMRAGDREQPFLAVFRCVCNEDGSPFFESLEQAEQAALWLILPMFDACVEEVIPQKKSQARGNSGGATSRSRSAAKRSKSSKRR